MSEARLRVRPASYSLVGPAVLVDLDGHELRIAEGESVALCRCGRSATKPFCDSSHKRVGFASSACLLDTEEGKAATKPQDPALS